MHRIASVLLLSLVALAADAAALPQHVDASLVAGSAGSARGAPLWIGLKMRHDPGWHTYWKNPGDAGMPTRIEWTLPAGWSASGINWPAPERLQVGPLASYGYEGELVLPVKIQPPAGWDAKSPVQIVARAAWLVCKEQCIPESANLMLNLPARSQLTEESLLESWRARVPHPFRFKTALAARIKGRLEITLAPVASGAFFPEREELVEPGDPPQVTLNGDRATWSARLGVQGKSLDAPANIAGVWVPKSGRPLYVEAKLK